MHSPAVCCGCAEPFPAAPPMMGWAAGSITTDDAATPTRRTPELDQRYPIDGGEGIEHASHLCVRECTSQYGLARKLRGAPRARR